MHSLVLWKIGCANEPEIHQGFLKAGWSLSTDQLAHNYFPLLRAYLRHFLKCVCLSELHFLLPLWTLLIISQSCLPLYRESYKTVLTCPSETGAFTTWVEAGLYISLYCLPRSVPDSVCMRPFPGTFLLPISLPIQGGERRCQNR